MTTAHGHCAGGRPQKSTRRGDQPRRADQHKEFGAGSRHKAGRSTQERGGRIDRKAPGPASLACPLARRSPSPAARPPHHKTLCWIPSKDAALDSQRFAHNDPTFCPLFSNIAPFPLQFLAHSSLLNAPTFSQFFFNLGEGTRARGKGGKGGGRDEGGGGRRMGRRRGWGAISCSVGIARRGRTSPSGKRRENNSLG